MARRNSRNGGVGDPDSSMVSTPGGPRPRSSTHEVAPGEVAVQDETGALEVLNPRDLAQLIERAASVKTSDYVSTPGGFRPPEMVHRIDRGQALRVERGALFKTNLSSGKSVELASSASPGPMLPALGSGWICYGYWNNGTGRSITSFSTTWKVPPAPTKQGSQLIYLFNGIQNFGANYGILQPVLQWGVSAAGGGAYWSVANWYVLSGGIAVHTPAVKVNVGDVLTGVIRQTGSSGTNFSYTSEFTGVGTILTVENIAELLWCSETLEAYSVDECGNYPATLATHMTDIHIRSATGSLTPQWTPVSAVTDCGQHAVIADRSIRVHLPPRIGGLDAFLLRTEVHLYLQVPSDSHFCDPRATVMRANVAGRC